MVLTESEVPASCLDEHNVILGIDEAGRGPILGPMVYGAAYWPQDMDETMRTMGFDDSKALSHQVREKLFDKIKATEDVGYVTRVIPAAEISHNMLTRRRNLNEMSRDAAIEMILAVKKRGVNIVHVYVDTVGDPGWYQSFLTKHFNGTITFTVEKKADSKYKVVSAASICAKVTRDAQVSQWEWEHASIQLGKEYGSGYPSDPKTKQWLADSVEPVFGYPNIVRFSWGTMESYLDRMANVEWPHEKEDGPKGTQSIMSFMNTTTKKRKRSPYFEQNRLQVVSEL
ncbi:ribonuclease H2 subunit A [Thraustotheca clavata]|uniref:Ribonuclease n=1 Tax=Thraustotheca clavata TaxID=74557 RepID=A0A1V9Z9W9_9STRA|nr:ribonuclease H2 subunit A [Thraustotheca clavata]